MKNDAKILVSGARGQLGSELRNLLGDSADYVDIDTAGSPDDTGHIEALDITDGDAVTAFFSGRSYDFILNCAAYTAVDAAETEKLACHRANVDAVENIAKAATTTGARIVHISTDYVFDGTSSRPYLESDKTNPVCVYGASKRRGETALIALAPDSIIIRTGWLYSSYGHNFVKTILERAGAGKALRVVSDQAGTPTYAADLAAAIVAIIRSRAPLAGIYHYSNEGIASWYDLAVAVVEEAGIAADISPVTTADYPTAATRPQYSVLDKNKIKATFNITIPHWRTSLRRCIKLINDNGKSF